MRYRYLLIGLCVGGIMSTFIINSPKNVLGTLGFQLFLSGTSEEILYCALPVTVLVYVFGKNIRIKWDITLEVVLASLLFTAAHIKWSLFPFSVDFIL
jgi:hypothetical protein